MIDNIITFQEAIEKCEGQGKHILLGNGFSIACKKDIFLYEKLFETADFKNNIRLRDCLLYTSTQTRSYAETGII